MSESRKTLTEACSNVFLFLTTFRRNAATSKLSIKELQQALLREVDAARTQCEGDLRLRPLFERMHYPLVAMADQVVLTSTWAQRAGWLLNLLETQVFKSAEGGKRFYKIVEEILADPAEQARELAELLFTCMGLGFQGELIRERKEYERRRQLLFDKARLPSISAEPLAPDCYGRNLVRAMPRLPTVGILRALVVAAAALALAFLVVWWVTSNRNSSTIQIINEANPSK
ncbi:MAG: DotU family type IV/VI secretion system protein [Myxococcales bacterium]|nr:DotU family type IV/VI secretion system protein [Myxococcales bacterium]